MTANVQGSNILDVLKKKMRATKEEAEKYKEDAEDLQRKLQIEVNRREEVGFFRKLEGGRNPDILSVIFVVMSHIFVNDFITVNR